MSMLAINTNHVLGRQHFSTISEFYPSFNWGNDKRYRLQALILFVDEHC